MCWDWNDTLVDYKNGLRPHAKYVMESLKARGFVHAITTTIDAKWVQTELGKLGIDALVDKVFGDRRSNDGRSKLYKAIVDHYSLTNPENDAIVIGDKPHDHPGDVQNLVFIYNPKGSETDARVVQQLLAHLQKCGNDSFYAGWQASQRTSADFQDELGFVYHAMMPLAHKYSGVVLSTKNGSKWLTPTVAVLPDKEAKEQFLQFEAIR